MSESTGARVDAPRWGRAFLEGEGLFRTLTVAGLLARFALLFASTGSNDIRTWRRWIPWLVENDIVSMYERYQHFNHPPLMGYYAEFAWFLSQWTGLRFPVCFKLPMVLAELLAAWLVFRIAAHRGGRTHGWRAAAVYAWSVVAILVTSFHGSTDGLCAALTLLAAYLVAVRGSPLGGGLALGAAINVKLIPVLLIPALFSQMRDRRQFALLLAGLAVGTLPFLPILWQIPETFLANVVGYGSHADNWGVHALLRFSWGERGAVVQALSEFYGAAGKYLMLAVVLGISVEAARSRRFDLFESLALCSCAFLFFGPGWAVQYALYPAAFLIVTSLPWGLAYSTLAGVHIGLTYAFWWNGSFPLSSVFQSYSPVVIPGFVVWCVLGYFLASRILDFRLTFRRLAPEN